MKTAFIPLLSLTISTVWAMESIQTDPLDVEGIYRNRSHESDRRFETSNEKTQDRLREKTDELNRKISKKKEDKLIETDEKITSKVLQVIEGIDLNDEKSSAHTPPPVVEQTVLPPIINTFKEEPLDLVKKPEVGLSKFTPYIGMMNITNDQVNLNAETSVGVIAESMLLNQKTSLFMDFNYSDLTMEPILRETVDNIQDYVIDYRRYSLDFGIKGYLLHNHAMKPFVGASVGFNHIDLEYNQRPQSQGITSNYFTASIKAGTEISISEDLGINIAVKYIKNINSTVDASSPNLDQYRLESLAKSLEEADILSFNGGLILSF